MKMNLLIYVDSEHYYLESVKFTTDLFKKEKPDITILQVEKKKDKIEAGENVQKAKDILESYGFDSKLKVRHGKSSEEILKETTEGEYNIVIIGARYLNEVPIVIGEPPHDSLLEDIIQNIETSFLVVRNPRELNKALIFTDGTSSSENAIDFWCSLRKDFSPVTNIIDIIPEFYKRFKDYLQPIAKEQSESDVFTAIPGEKTEELKKSKEKLNEYGMETNEIHLREGIPEDNILKESERGYDIIILGTSRKKSRVNKATYRVARRVARRAHIPVLVINEESDFGREKC